MARRYVAPYNKNPKIRVEPTTPIVLKINTGQRCCFNFSKSKCRALANSRNPSMISSNVLEKSMLLVSWAMKSNVWGIVLPKTEIKADKITEITITPMVPGNLIKRLLR